VPLGRRRAPFVFSRDQYGRIFCGLKYRCELSLFNTMRKPGKYFNSYVFGKKCFLSRLCSNCLISVANSRTENPITRRIINGGSGLEIFFQEPQFCLNQTIVGSVLEESCSSFCAPLEITYTLVSPSGQPRADSVELFIFPSLILKGRWSSWIIRQYCLLRSDKLPVHIDPKEKLLLVEQSPPRRVA